MKTTYKIGAWIHPLLVVIILSFSMTACNEDDTFTESIFVDKPAQDPGSATYAFDSWLDANYLVPYNLQFRYKMQDVGSDMDYNLVPTSLERSESMAILVKYLWFDVYKEVVSETFLKEHGPRIIHLIGSPAYNPSLGTMVLGTAEGGIKVTLYNCNMLNVNNLNIDVMNEYYFKTIHHEFAHILHQKRMYPKEFENYSAGYYDPDGWQHRTDSEAASLGFVSPYAGSQPREDFVEIIANYIVKTDAQWNAILDRASKPGVNQSGETVQDPLDGKALILIKLGIAEKWLKEAWQIELKTLRAEVQERQLHIAEVLNESYW
ncbi:MAG: putative zinc-binding metallopeptidase [Tannerellaceae bacterium]|nr:putative zinc-binding metallopeptidase [Tannerellaceae bacterium]